MIAMVRVGPYEKKFSELNISNIKYSSIMGSFGRQQYIFALDDYSKEKYWGDWLIQPEEYKLDDTVYTKFIEAGENEKYPNFYTALNFFDLLKQTLYSKDEAQVSCEQIINELSWIETADPQYDAAEALKKHDNKFKAVMSYAVSLPGVDEETYSQSYKTGNYNIIKGTSDGICSKRHLELNIKAREYAETYNKIILLQ